MSQFLYMTSNRTRSKPQVDEEEYIKYLMFISEAVQSEDVDTDTDTHVPTLSTLVNKARDVSMRPYYRPDALNIPCLFSKDELPPISNIRQAQVKLPYIQPSLRTPLPRLF